MPLASSIKQQRLVLASYTDVGGNPYLYSSSRISVAATQGWGCDMAPETTVEEAMEELASDLAWLWEEYVLAAPDELSEDAKELAERLRVVSERHGLSV